MAHQDFPDDRTKDLCDVFTSRVTASKKMTGDRSSIAAKILANGQAALGLTGADGPFHPDARPSTLTASARRMANTVSLTGTRRAQSSEMKAAASAAHQEAPRGCGAATVAAREGPNGEAGGPRVEATNVGEGWEH